MAWDVAVVIGFVGTAFVVAYIASVLDEEEYKQLKLLFFLFSILILLFNVGIMKEVVDNDGADVKTLIDGFYSIFMPIIVFIVGILFLYLIWKIFTPMIEEVRKRR